MASSYQVAFSPIYKAVTVPAGTTLLEAAGKAGITIDSVCGGDGICGRCKMIVVDGAVGGRPTTLLSREEIRRGVVLACQTTVEGDLRVEIPAETRAKDKVIIDADARRFRAVHPGVQKRHFDRSAIAEKVLLHLDKPSLANNLDDCRRVRDRLEKLTGTDSIQAGLKVIRKIPEALRAGDFTVTVTLGHRRAVAEIMDVQPGDTAGRNAMAVIDVGTSTIVAHLVDVGTTETLAAEACFNSQSTYGREVTARMIAAEKRGPEALQRLLVEDINRLLSALVARCEVNLGDITAVVCAGNTAMMHFLLGLPTRNIRRSPYVAASLEPPPLRAAEVGIKINPRGLLLAIPGIGGWVGGDLTAGILATGLYEMDGLGMLIDIGTNGEIILGNKEWMMACSASAGPALEGAGVACGMMAQQGAIEKVFLDGDEIRHEVIGGGKPDGLCGSGIIDLLAVLLDVGAIDRAGRLQGGRDPRVRTDGGKRFVLVDREETLTGREISLRQEDIDNVVTAKAAIFAAARILLDRLDLGISDIDRLMIAGGFGSYVNLDNAVAIGLLPDLPAERITYVGNTSIWGTKLAAFSGEARELLRQIIQGTTYYDLMGAEDYVEQFRQAMFLPHTNIEWFPSARRRSGAERKA